MTRSKRKPQDRIWHTQPVKKKRAPGALTKAMAVPAMLRADAAYAKAVRSGDRTAIASAARRMRTAQKAAGVSVGLATQPSVGAAVKARQAYEQALASGDRAAIRRAASQVRGIQKRAGLTGQRRDRKGRFA